MSNGPANPRYEVQTRSGLSWGWYCGNDDLSVAFRKAREAKRTGYTVRVWDSRALKVIPIPR
jgi:hypothetical protein